MPDAAFADPRLAAVYDPLDPDRSDLGPYLAMVSEFGAQSVADVGCGTGVFALLLAERGYDVVGVDPAAASLAVARAKPGAQRVRWMDGDATVLPEGSADLVTMTANVAQAIVEPADWQRTVASTHDALRPGGRLIFETRDPAYRAWTEWTTEPTTTVIDGVGAVTTSMELVSVALPLVSFRATITFESDGAVLTSDSTLRFRERDEITNDLERHGFAVDEVRDAPDRPGREFVFVARRR